VKTIIKDGHAFGGRIETVVTQQGSIVVKTTISNIFPWMQSLTNHFRLFSLDLAW
jgi:hypothetical protein